MRRIIVLPALAMFTAPCLPGSIAAADGEAALPIIRDRQGRILTDSDANPATDKKPGNQEPNEATAEAEVISREAAGKMREALKPLKERLNTRGIRTAEIEYLENLRLWAVRQDDRLKEHRKILSAYEKLKDYRDGAAAKGDNTSRIDPRLEDMEKRLMAMSADIRAANAELVEMTSRYEARLKRMSQLITTQHEAALAVIEQARGETPGSGTHR